MDESGSQSVNLRQRQAAMSRWDNDGGATPAPIDIPDLTNAELVNLRVRLIALENLVIALLAEGSDRQQAVVREMATYIAPRQGYTQHPLTVQAAAYMVQLVDRAVHFQELPPS